MKKAIKSMVALALVFAMLVGFSAQSYAILDRTFFDPRLKFDYKTEKIEENGITYKVSSWKELTGATVVQAWEGDSKDLYEIKISSNGETVTASMWKYYKILFFGFHAPWAKKVGTENVADFSPVLAPFVLPSFGDMVVENDLIEYYSELIAESEFSEQFAELQAQASFSIDCDVARYKSNTAYFWLDVTGDGKKLCWVAYGKLGKDGYVTSIIAGAIFDYYKLNPAQKEHYNRYKDAIAKSNYCYTEALKTIGDTAIIALFAAASEVVTPFAGWGELIMSGLDIIENGQWFRVYMDAAKEEYNWVKELYPKILTYNGIGT